MRGARAEEAFIEALNQRFMIERHLMTQVHVSLVTGPHEGR